MVQLKPLRDKYVQVIIEAQDQLLEFGRQRVDEPDPLAIRSIPGGKRLIIADKHNTSLGRDHVRLVQSSTPDNVQVENIHTEIAITVNSIPLPATGKTEVRLPADLRIGNIQLEVKGAGSADQFMTLNERPSSLSLKGGTRAGSEAVNPLNSLRATLTRGDHESLLYRMEQLVEVLQASASSPDFMQRIAEASIQLIELDHGAVVLWQDDWKVVASADKRSGLPTAEWRPSQTLLHSMRIKRRTTFSGPQQPMDHEVSLANVVEFVASPILNPDGEVIGAVYGDRHTNTGGLRRPIEKMDAQLVEILACGIAGGLQRLQKEREAMERRVQFDAFVTPEVASMIEKDPEALSGRDADVTMLFCDIAGFSGISEKLSPTQTFDWINDVMASLSKCVKDHGGTIVDYVGDELIAMWGAPFPTEHEHHAHAASRAAIAMIKSLPGIDAKWQSITQVPTQVGVGLNSGKVRVGNTGCQFKFKYGPLGSTVNIASRIQGATRFLRTPILITGATAELLNDEFPVRRLCKLRVKNIETPIDIFELPTDPRDDWGLRRSDYAVALTAWEQRNLQDAVNSLSQIVATYKDDVPALVMLGRAIEVWSHGHTHYDPVWTLPSK